MSEAEITSITPEFVLITYDMPAAMKAARHRFLRDAKAMGAVEHSQSCYYLPYSSKSLGLANTLAEIPEAKVYVHLSAMPDHMQAVEMMDKYEQHVKIRCSTIEQRLVTAQQYMADGKLGLANQSFNKTLRLIEQLYKINETFKPDWLAPKIYELAKQLKAIYSEGERR